MIIHDRHNVLGKELRDALSSLSTRILGPSALIQRALPAILEYTPQSFFDEIILFIEVSFFTGLHILTAAHSCTHSRFLSHFLLHN